MSFVYASKSQSLLHWSFRWRLKKFSIVRVMLLALYVSSVMFFFCWETESVWFERLSPDYNASLFLLSRLCFCVFVVSTQAMLTFMVSCFRFFFVLKEDKLLAPGVSFLCFIQSKSNLTDNLRSTGRFGDNCKGLSDHPMSWRRGNLLSLKTYGDRYKHWQQWLWRNQERIVV